MEIGSAIMAVTLNKQTHSFLTPDFMTKPIIKSSSRAEGKRLMAHVGTQLKFEALRHQQRLMTWWIQHFRLWPEVTRSMAIDMLTHTILTNLL